MLNGAALREASRGRAGDNYCVCVVFAGRVPLRRESVLKLPDPPNFPALMRVTTGWAAIHAAEGESPYA